MKKMILLCILFFGVMSNTAVLHAVTTEDYEVSNFYKYLQEVTPEWNKTKLKPCNILHGINDEEIGRLYRVYTKGKQQRGYIVYDYNKGVIEAAWEGTDNALSIKGNVYYISPGQFMSKSKFDEYIVKEKPHEKGMTFGYVGNITSVSSNNTFSYQILNLSLNTSMIPSLSGNVTTTTTYSSIKKVINNVPDYKWREGCTPTSLANVIAYFDNLWHNTLADEDGSSNFSYTQDSTTISNSLIDEIASYLDTNSSGGTTQPGLVYGWEEYLDDYSHSTYEVYFGSFYPLGTISTSNHNDYQTLISNGNPVVINIYNHDVYSNHSVTGVGYLLGYPSVSGAIVHDNWSSTSREIFLSYTEIHDYYFMYNV